MAIPPPFPHGNPRCRRCDLHEACRSVCIPMRPWREPQVSHDTALLVIGKAPGHTEDQEGQCFIGPAGQILDTWMEAMSDLPVDIWLTNVVRCRLAGGDDQPLRLSQVKACRKYLAADLQYLRARYGRVVLLVVGADASAAIGNGNLRTALKHNGDPLAIIDYRDSYTIKSRRTVKVGDRTYRMKPGLVQSILETSVGTFPTFTTNHPAALLPSRSPEKIHDVLDHLSLLHDYLLGEADATVSVTPGIEPRWPTPNVRLVALDIETYGILEGRSQNHFHPTLSALYDGADDPIETLHLAWYDSSDQLCTGSFVTSRESFWDQFIAWIRQFKFKGGTLVFMNALFDLSYLRHRLRLSGTGEKLLRPPLVVEDLVLWNQASNDQRSARDLKSLQTLFRLRPTGESHVFRQYPSASDPLLHQYGKQDAATTLVLRDKLRDRASPESRTESVRQYYSQLIWSTLHMFESGVKYDRSTLEDLRTDAQSRMKLIEQEFQRRTSSPIKGKGSKASVEKVYRDAYDLVGYTRLTDKGNLMSDKVATQELLLDLPEGEVRDQVSLVRDYRKLRQLDSHFLSTRLGMLTENQGLVFPYWHLAPSSFNDRDKPGGTIQSRITASKPPVQTDPPEVVDCIDSRFRPGFIASMDLKQIELVVAALQSRDQALLKGLKHGDLHTQTAISLWGEGVTSRDNFRGYWRHAAKTSNFLILYRGGPRRLQRTLLEESGIRFSIGECRRIVSMKRLEHPELWQWQESLINRTTRDGYLVEPLTGNRRWLTQSESTNRDTLESTICNFLVQAPAAAIANDLQNQLVLSLEARELKSRLICNTYDALKVDGPLEELAQVREILESSLTHNVIWSKLTLGTVPWTLKAEFDIRLFT